jgi:phosphonate transport system substrate-binding protein
LSPIGRALSRVGVALAAIVTIAACGGGEGTTLYIGGVPDQDLSLLEGRFEKLAEYLSQETDLDVRYLPSTDYAAVVIGFRTDSLQLAWFGGLTGVQARLAVPHARALARRAGDERFHSVFVAPPDSGIESITDLRDRSFSFGSESSTSGHLMPRFYITEAGLDPEEEFAAVNYSGSHDKTWKLVEAGAWEAGALNANVWETRVKAGVIDLSKVDAFWSTPPYFDYHWVARPDLDEVYGEGVTERLNAALLDLDAGRGGIQAEIMDAFQADRFIPTEEDNYGAIEQVARQLGIIK